MTSMTSKRPYLLRGLYEWIVDNGCSPYVLVDAVNPEVVVPEKFVNGGRIVLNVSQKAVQNLRIGNDALECSARFGSQIAHLYVPVSAILAIFAHETSEGMSFEFVEGTSESKQRQEAVDKAKKSTKGFLRKKAKAGAHLTLVKSE